MYTRKMPVECYTRIVGYFRPKNDCNPGKKEELELRKQFNANKYCEENFNDTSSITV